MANAKSPTKPEVEAWPWELTGGALRRAVDIICGRGGGGGGGERKRDMRRKE